MSRRDATIYDVAKQAGVSVATVSRVLNEPSRVLADTRKRVLDAIAALQFVPKASAVAHARQQFKKIGVIAPFFTQPSFMQRLRGVSAVLSGHHYELVIYAIESSEELDAYIDMLATSKRLDGLIVLCLTLSPASAARLSESGIPVCFVEKEMDGFDSVVVDNYRGGRLAAEYLWKQGYRRPGFVGEASSRVFAVPATDERLAGFRDFFTSQGVAVDEGHIWVGEFTEELVDLGVERIITQAGRPDCVFASSDMIAVRLMKLTARYGLRAPENYGVIGFDDLDIAEHLNLSTVNQYLDESGRLAAEMILDRLKKPDRAPRKVVVPLKVMERDSAGVATPVQQ